MPKSKLILLILVALLMAFAASAVANRMMDNKLNKEEGKQNSAKISVVTAVTDIAYGQALSTENLMLKTLPEALVPPGTIGSIEEATGKIAKGEIFQGEILLAKRLTGKEEGTILAALVNKNMRAVSIRVNDVIGVAGFLLPGNRVDVLASRMEDRRSITRTVLRNIKVLAVDQTAEASKDKPLLVQAVTVEVSPADSEKLFQAVQEGSIHLTLRNPVDSSDQQIAETIPTPPVQQTESQLAKTKELALPAKKKKKPQRKKKKRKHKTRLVSKKITHKINDQQPVTNIIPAKKPVLTSTVTVIRGITQQEITMIKKGFTDGGQSMLPDSN
ncbi:MAG: Flp pilus assembly protein CpaB [Thiolinea sp.]